MTAIPPNNLEQLIAWVRLFSENISSQFLSLESQVKNLKQDIRRIQNEHLK